MEYGVCVSVCVYLIHLGGYCNPRNGIEQAFYTNNKPKQVNVCLQAYTANQISINVK